MHRKQALTPEMREGIHLRPLTASFCLHFIVALFSALALIPPVPPQMVQSIALAHVTLKPPGKNPTFLDEGDDRTISEAESPSGTSQAHLIGDPEAPITTSQLQFAGFAAQGIPVPFAARASAADTAPRLTTPSSRGILGPSAGNTEADERLMQKDIERSLANKPPSGPSTEVSLFGEELTGHSFVFVIDRSASTSTKHYTASAQIEDECVKAIEALPAENRFQVVLYNERVSITQGLRMATNAEKAAAKERMIRFSLSGGTMHMDALRAALLLRANVVCWFSDGDDPFLSPREVEELALLAAESKTQIHAWRLGKRPDDPAKDFMQALAERTGGEFHEGVPAVRK
jgi:hypothetical protein